MINTINISSLQAFAVDIQPLHPLYIDANNCLLVAGHRVKMKDEGDCVLKFLRT